LTVASETSPPRLVGTLNFRDVGGLPTENGKRTVAGAVYRSDALEHITEEDVRLIHDVLGVGAIVDLRSHIEGGQRPSWASDSTIGFFSLPLDDAMQDWSLLEPDKPRALIVRKYVSYLEVAALNIVASIDVIARNAGSSATIIHCAVGKDRTGIVIALLLEVLGVTREAIVEDYLLTEPNMPSLIERLSESELYRERVKTNPPEVYHAERHTIELFLDELASRGGAEQWLLANGLEPERVRTLRAALLEPEGER